MASALAPPDALESAAIEAETRSELRDVVLFTVRWGALTDVLWYAVDLALEPAHAQLFGVLRAVIVTGLLTLGAVLRRDPAPTTQRMNAITFVLLAIFGLIAPAVALAEHYAVYVLGYSMIIWASAVLLRWTWPVAAVTYAAVLLEFAAAQLLPGATAAPALFFGAMVYLATTAMLMVVQASSAHAVKHRSLLLSLRLEQRNADLSSALEQLRVTQSRLVETEKLSALGRLLAGLSHEINNPINVICNTVSSVRDDGRTLTEALQAIREGAKTAPLSLEAVERVLPVAQHDALATDLREAVDDLDLSARRIRNIHRDLRSFVRGDTQPHESADLQVGLQATVGMARRGAAPGIEWKVSTEALPALWIQPDQVNQIVFNLLQNAIDAIGAQGVITVTTAVEPEAVILSVIDSGPGVLTAVADRVFEPFFTTKPVGQGTGLGLSISRELALKNGGALDLNRSHAPGARFDLRLPRAKAGP